MADIKPSIVLEDSRGCKFFFYYRDSSIYYREVSNNGDTKDTILISQANADYAAVIDSDDTIYLICNSRYKGVLLFTYTNNGWKFESVVTLHNSSNIYIMDMLVASGSIHVFFSKKLPIANMYNVYHIQKSIHEQTPYIEYSWRKNGLSEIYSQNIESSYSLLPAKGGLIHYASVWYDGSHYYINYYCYDDSTKSWLQKSLNISYKNQVSIKLINQNKKINLLCFSYENEASNIHHFLSKSAGLGEIDFKELNNSFIDTNGITPLFYTDDKAIQLAWIKDSTFHQYTFDDSSGKWRKAIDLPVTSESNIQMIKVIKSSNSISITKGYFLLDRDYNVCRPIEHSYRNEMEEKSRERRQTETSTEMNEYLKQIFDQIKDLADNVKYLNSRIDNLEGRAFVQKTAADEYKELPAVRPRAADTDSNDRSTLKKSNFKEKFLKSTSTPNYDSLLVNQDSIITYVGKPGAVSSASSNPTENKTNIDNPDSRKNAYVAPSLKTPQSIADNNTADANDTAKGTNFMKKIGEFFK